MQYLVNQKEMQTLDRMTTCYFKVPEIVLMEQAALSFVDMFITQIYKKENHAKVLVVCGFGNNAADGIAIARLLNQKNICTDVYYLANPSQKVSDSYKIQKDIYTQYGYTAMEYGQEIDFDAYEYIIDAIFGVGLSRIIGGSIATVIDKINQSKKVIVAVDIPSGVGADKGDIMGTAVCADYTITFSYVKIGQYLWPGADYCGKVIVAPIGITNESWLEQKPTVASYTKDDLELIPKRCSHSNKGTYGKVLVIAGNVGMAGAAYLSAKAAYLSGSGLVKIITPEENRVPLQILLPEAILDTYVNSEFEESFWLEQLLWPDVVVIGPGIGKSEISEKILDCVLTNRKTPLIIDADAINILSKYKKWLERLDSTCIITPHLGEMSRLIGKSIPEISQNLVCTAREFTRTYQSVCVLKDARTITATSDGLCYLNASGNNGMSTAGSGDILTGIIASLIGQGLDCNMAASLGVYLHGLAGDEAYQNVGYYGMIAEDIMKGIKDLLKRVENHEQR